VEASPRDPSAAVRETARGSTATCSSGSASTSNWASPRRWRFDYKSARPTRTALDAYRERRGVCRDFTHLAITLCRCMNIPASYTTGYLGDIGVEPLPGPMDFSAWFEVFLGERWYTFDARHNQRRIGRIVMARGRDAGDVPLTMCFGPNTLLTFDVVTEEIVEGDQALAA
jgi:transglutaminase-like putative cysteine protease